jgi:hypothetical protein
VHPSASGHQITPLAGSARRVRDGAPADLTNPHDYPCEAVCLGCGQPVRIERFYLGEWVHIERFTDPAG